MLRLRSVALLLALLVATVLSSTAAYASPHAHAAVAARADAANPQDDFEKFLEEAQSKLSAAAATATIPSLPSIPSIPSDPSDTSTPSFALPSDASAPTDSLPVPTGGSVPYPPTGPGLPPPTRPPPAASLPDMDSWFNEVMQGLEASGRGKDDGAPPAGNGNPDAQSPSDGTDGADAPPAGNGNPDAQPPSDGADGANAPPAGDATADVPPAMPTTGAGAGAPAALAPVSVDGKTPSKPSPEFAALQGGKDAAALVSTSAATAPNASAASDDGAVGDFGAINDKIRKINLYSSIGAAILIATGLIFVFSGHQTFKLILWIAGFYLGAVFSYVVLTAIESRGHSFGSSRDLLFFIITLVIGIAIGTLFVCIWKLGLIAVGAALGFTISMLVLSLAKDGVITQGTGRAIFIAALTIIGAVAVLFAERPILIIGTAVTGAFAVVWGVDVFTRAGLVEATNQFLSGTGEYTPDKWVYLELGGAVLLALVGIAVQWRGHRVKESRHKNHHNSSNGMHAAKGYNSNRSVGGDKASKGERTKLVAEFEKIVVEKR
ncbi:hypothetical protein HDU87_002356 [Geranomyces variabilis]|uniref:Transmembrane protein 198 n=1 Tax=Geranomyces variabilis TaxID=109894 RepID=A0AAD5TL59_9FUNG|nr:hypothetical protein HDU87_002356 [Geranomyces variabilis]